MMTLDITPSHADFVHGGTVAGRYNYRDAFKPYLHPLRTPRGHVLSLASPHDHVHHKGLMYALRTFEVNFWEERSTKDDEAVGAQRHVGFSDVVAAGESVGFVERIDWVSTRDGSVIFRETRELGCRFDPRDFGYRWTWNTRLVPEADATLIQSQWSHKISDAQRINYHGLGVRLRREFGGSTGGCHLILDGVTLDARDFTAAMGQRPKAVTYIGSIDATWPVERGYVTIIQQQADALFSMNTGFAFMALGPSNAGEMKVKKGEVIEGRYEVLVGDWVR